MNQGYPGPSLARQEIAAGVAYNPLGQSSIGDGV